VSVEGYEMYSWQAQGEWRFALVIGTNYAKTHSEISRPEVRLQSLEALKCRLGQLPSGERVVWSDLWVPNTALPPDDIVEEVRAYCEHRGIQLTMPVQAVEVDWNTSATALIVRYYSPHTTASPGAYDHRYYIPEVQVWGDGRIIWVQREHPQRRVLEGDLTSDQVRALLQRIVDAGFFNWRDKYYTLGGYSHSPMYLSVSLAGQSKELYEHGGAPSAFYELREFLTSGAGAAGHDHVPARGYLTVSPGPDEANVQEWPDVASGITLDQVVDGCYIEGEALAFAWEAANRYPTAPTYVRSKGQVYTIMLQIPRVSFYEPPLEGATVTWCPRTAAPTSKASRMSMPQLHPTFTSQPIPKPAATSTGTPQPAPVLPDTLEPPPPSTLQSTSVPASALSESPQVVSFIADPSPADPAGMTTLSWCVRGASDVEVSWSDKRNDNVVHSQLPPSGSLDLAVSGVKFTAGDGVRFFLSATDANGQLMMDENGRAVTKVLTVPLKTDMSITSFTASPDPVEQGGTVTLTWNAPNAYNVGITRLSPEGGILLIPEALDLPPSGSIALPVPDEYVTSITYYLGARDVNGVLQRAYVTVSITCRYEGYVTPECPLTHDHVHAAYEAFEHGHMVWRGDTREIYVLYDDGSSEAYEDTWTEGEPTYFGETPPQGLLKPVRGFGNLWATHRGVRDRLGWATEEESGFTMLVETVRRYFGRYPRSAAYFRLPDDRVVYLDESPGEWGFLLPTEGHVQMNDPVSRRSFYRSAEYRFVFEYPSEVVLEFPLKGETPVLVRTNDEKAFDISARKGYLPGDAAYFLDTPPSGMLALGDNVWQTYELPHGHGDGPSVSLPILALRMEARDVLYTIVFHGQKSMGPTQEEILSTFRLLE
jgi:hypothetical protein